MCVYIYILEEKQTHSSKRKVVRNREG